jgi:O-antigen/teichoic acid export membrane protein
VAEQGTAGRQATTTGQQPSRLAGLLAVANVQLRQRLATGAGRMALTVLGIRIAGAGLAYLSQVLLARWMGADDYGVFAVVWTLALVLGLLASLGFSASPGRFVPTYLAANQMDRLRGFLSASRLLALFTAGLATLIGLEILWWSRAVIDPVYVWPAAIALLAVPFFALTGVQDAIARSQDLPALGLLSSFIYRPLLLLALILPLVLAGQPVTAAIAAILAVAAHFLTTAHQAWRLQRQLNARVPAGPHRYVLKLWIGVSLPLLMVEGLLQLLSSADVIMVSFWQPPEQVAIYFAASKTLAMVHFVHFAVRSASAHRFAGLAAGKDKTQLAVYARQASRWTFWPSVAGGLGLLLLSPLLLAMFGPQFVDGMPLMAILLIGVLARASIGPADALLGMTGHQKSCAVVYACVFAVNVALNAALIPAYGLVGAAVATALAMIAEAIALAVVSRRKLGFIPFALVPNKRSVVSKAGAQ